VKRYAALAVVVASVFLVASNNIASRSDWSETRINALFPKNPKAASSAPAKTTHNNIADLPHLTSAAIIANDRDEKDIEEESYASLTNTKPTSALAYLSAQSFVAAAQAMERDPEIDGGVKLYTVKEGDTASSIALKHDITVNTLYWANNIEDIDEIMPGDTLFILPVAGLKYTVKEGDDIESIAEKNEVDAEQIIAFNELPADGRLEKDQEIIIPGAEKDIPEPEPEVEFFAPRQYAGSDGKSVENRHGKPNRFPYGYCTWYVAQHKYIPWSGNAGAWLYNAKAMGYATGSKPKKGSIVVTTDSPYYGHVALVTGVSNSSITVKEMNYKGWGVSNTRTIDRNSRSIRGYIY